MIIRYAEGEEIDIQASRAELETIRSALLRLSQTDDDHLAFQAESGADPEEFDRCLGGLDFVHGTGQIEVGVSDNRVIISGSQVHFDPLSGYFTFEKEDKHPEHHHLEYRPGHEILDETAIPVVIWIQKE